MVFQCFFSGIPLVLPADRTLLWTPNTRGCSSSDDRSANPCPKANVQGNAWATSGMNMTDRPKRRDSFPPVMSSSRISVWCATCIIILAHFSLSAAQLSKDCDVTIESKPGMNKSGTFASPNWPGDYDNHLRCIYRFIGQPNEKVQLTFTEFQVKGVHQRCQDDYVDVYTQVHSPYADLLDLPLHGRYCGDDITKLPHLLISMYHSLILGFYTDDDHVTRGFNGTYKFIDASVYSIGTTVAPNACGQKIYSHSVTSGTIVSPTYPGVYPDNVFCFYKLIGRKGQRVRFTFNDLDMYSGGDHCPYDYIKIYDGYTNEAEVIGIYCGKLQELKGMYMPPVVFSTKEALLIEFVTSSGRAEPTTPLYFPYHKLEQEPIRQTGFNATFEFSEHFVKLDFIHEGVHIRGTECDQRVFSEKETNGTITTPNYPSHYPPNIMCKFYVDGLDDKENLEKTRLTFEDFDVPSVGNDCSDAFVKAYIKGQDIREKPNSEDGRFCGKSLPAPLVSENPRLLLVFQGGIQAGMGFKANFQFVTDYDIDGTPSPDSSECQFFYNSRSRKSGTFKSPRNPSHYLPSVMCTYEFLGLTGEQVRLTFETFKLQQNDPDCTHDYLKLYMVTQDKRGQEKTIPIGHYCQDHIPGPVVTDRGITQARVFFHSDDSVVMDGFKARYEFIREKTSADSSYCDKEYTQGLPGGVLKSPNHPRKYSINVTCETVIRTRPKTKILLQFFGTFDIEGRYDEDQKVYKCANAVLKIYTSELAGQPEYELCYKDASKLPAIVSEKNYVKIKFISSARATGKNGYKISWSELLPYKGESCPGFLCETNGYCISKELRCNQVPNCGGKNDESDEPGNNCGGVSYAGRAEIHIILGVLLSLIFLVFIIVCILHRRRKARKKKNKKEIEVRFVTRGGTPNRCSGPATDRLLKERTEKVSIV